MVRFGFGGLGGYFLGCVGFYSCRGCRWVFLPYGVSVGWWWVGSYCCAHGSCPGMLCGELGPHSPHSLSIHPTASPFTPWPPRAPHCLPTHPAASPYTPLPPHAPWRCPYKITLGLPKAGDSCPASIQTLQTAWTQHQQAQSCPMLRESSLGSTRYQLEGQHPNINTVFSGFGVVLCFFLTCSKDRRLRGPHNLTGLTMFPRAAFLPAWPTTTRACLYGSPSPHVF